jgi:hypothetical protein
MIPYLDGGFLLVLLARSPGTQAASTVLRGIAPPVSINLLHQLQVENMLIRLQKNPDPNLQVNGNKGLQLWNHYMQEGVFAMASANWESAFRNAITWNRLSHDAPPSLWLFLHPALALTLGTTHFCSFDPRTRIMAHMHGMRLLPETI